MTRNEHVETYEPLYYNHLRAIPLMTHSRNACTSHTFSGLPLPTEHLLPYCNHTPNQRVLNKSTPLSFLSYIRRSRMHILQVIVGFENRWCYFTYSHCVTPTTLSGVKAKTATLEYKHTSRIKAQLPLSSKLSVP